MISLQDRPSAVTADAETVGLLRLFNKSVSKQQKCREVVAMLGSTDGLCCLDIGADNGVISYLLRQRGGMWKSADLDEQTVQAIRRLVKTDVYRIDGQAMPFADGEFDRVVILDLLEHIHTDRQFMREVARVLKPDGEVIINVPHFKNTLLRRFRLALGQTDERHGHVRPGYTLESLKAMMGDGFVVEQHNTYSRFFSELIDVLIRQAIDLVKGKAPAESQKGAIVTGEDVGANQQMLKLYSLIYPVVWLFSRLDNLLFFTSGYMLIVKARLNGRS